MDYNKKSGSQKTKEQKDIVEITDKDLMDKLKDSNVVLENHKNPKKFSEIFQEFMEPLINEILDDETGLKNILHFGQFIWNKATAEEFPNNSKSKDIEKLFPFFRINYQDSELIEEFIERKKKLFKMYKFFIVEHTSHLAEDGRLSISIAVSVIE